VPDDKQSSGEHAVVEALRGELAKSAPSRRRRAIAKFVLAALGSIPWVGGFLSAAASYKAEEASIRQDSLQTQWLEEHHEKLMKLRATLEEVQRRFDSLGESIDERLQSDEYLGLVRKAFRAWDEADTEEKRQYTANLIVNAAGTRVCSDDVIRLFLDWLELYHEAHFAVIREIFKNPGSSRYEIWTALYGDTLPREDSAEADLFKLLIRDLSTGGVIRQERDVNSLGQSVRKTPQRRRRGGAPTTMESAFEDSKPYVLTELGKQFVHYTMSEVVARIAENSGGAG
jgi:hypothetical protein